MVGRRMKLLSSDSQWVNCDDLRCHADRHELRQIQTDRQRQILTNPDRKRKTQSDPDRHKQSETDTRACTQFLRCSYVYINDVIKNLIQTELYTV